MDLSRGEMGKMLQDFFHSQAPFVMPYDITNKKTSAADNGPPPTDGGFALHIREVRNARRNICIHSAGIICRPRRQGKVLSCLFLKFQQSVHA